MNKIAYLSTLSCILVAIPTVTFAQESTQHEVSLSLMEHQDFQNNFVRLNYKYYLTPMSSQDGVLSINPYLQRVGHIRLEHINLGANNRTALGGEYYFNDSWRVSGKLSYSAGNRGDFGQQDYVFDAEVGYFFGNGLELGVGRKSEFDPSIALYAGAVNSYTNYLIFARYTDIQQQQGWDTKVQYYIDSDDNVAQVSADYYFNKGLSVGVQYTYTDRELRPQDEPVYFQSPKNQLALTSTYWLTDRLSFSASLAKNIGNRAGLESIDLAVRYRF